MPLGPDGEFRGTHDFYAEPASVGDFDVRSFFGFTEEENIPKHFTGRMEAVMGSFPRLKPLIGAASRGEVAFEGLVEPAAASAERSAYMALAA